MNWITQSPSWLFILRRYLPRLAICSLVWEIGQLPLYTLWAEPRWSSIAFAILHCTVGDVMIGAAALLAALTLWRADEPASWRYANVGMTSIVLAVAYTVWSERVNLAKGSWSYSAWMPVLPWIDVGLAPLVQWVIVPSTAWWWAKQHCASNVQTRQAH